MGIPLRYSIRNLTRRKVRTFLTMLSMALVVSVSVVMFAFAAGMLSTVKSSGSPENLIIMDRKAASPTFSKISTEDFNLLKSLPQVKKDAKGEIMVSPECLHQSRVDTKNYINRPGTIRGVGQMFFDINRNLKITDGKMPSAGRKVIIGSLVHKTIGVPVEELAIGNKIIFGLTANAKRKMEAQGKKQDKSDWWEIVGHFNAGGSALDSEIIANLDDIKAVFSRASFSSVVLKLNRAGDMQLLANSLNSRQDIQVTAVPEQEYYRGLAEGFERVIYLAVMLAVIAMIGGLVSGMNTMYASVLGRVREIGTLKTLGFSPGAIIKSFLVESVLIAVIGGLLGCLAAWQVNGLQAKVAQGAMELHIDEYALAAGMCVAIFIGVMGALIPARKGARMKIPDALAAL
ncbi:MAG: FtsX-like permease family protein [Planctomycetota bacterium]